MHENCKENFNLKNMVRRLEKEIECLNNHLDKLKIKNIFYKSIIKNAGLGHHIQTNTLDKENDTSVIKFSRSTKTLNSSENKEKDSLNQIEKNERKPTLKSPPKNKNSRIKIDDLNSEIKKRQSVMIRNNTFNNRNVINSNDHYKRLTLLHRKLYNII
jgi:hypothetical protein